MESETKRMKSKGGNIIVSLTLVGFLALNGCTLVKDDSHLEKNNIGTNEIHATSLITLNEDNFAILNVGDHNSLGVLFQKGKMKYCNNKDIALGIMISSSAETEEEIYNDIEYTKRITQEHDVTFPVYLNIDDIITNDNLNNEMKKEIIRSYLEKASANHIYVGIAGTDTNLCRVREYCDIKGYDAYLIMDSEEIKYQGTYNVVQKIDGTIESFVDLESVIKQNNLNNPDNFANDGTYTISEGEDIIDIALKYGMSVNELLGFNNMRKKDAIAGCELRIPSIIGKKVTKNPTSTEYKQLDEPIRGCDMSYCQKTDANWEQLAQNFEFIILKSNQGLTKDSVFESNAKNCNLYGIPMGVYCYNDYTSINCNTKEEFVKKQQEQVGYTLKLLENKNIEYPVYLDVEGNIQETLGKDYVNEMIKIWCKEVTEAGYIPGLYCNQSHFKYLQSCLDYEISDKMEIWIAGGEQYGDETNPAHNIDYKKVEPSYVLDDEYFGATMAQSTNVATGAGAQDGRGHLDINFSTVDYTKSIEGEIEDDFEIKDFKLRNIMEYGVNGTVAILGVTIPLVGIGAIARRKSKGKIKTK